VDIGQLFMIRAIGCEDAPQLQDGSEAFQIDAPNVLIKSHKVNIWSQ